LSFAGQLVGTTSATKTVTIANNSTMAVTISGSGISATGNYSVVGSGTTPCPGATLAASGGKCTFSVSFSPSINGTIKGAVGIADNSAVTPQVYNVSGTGNLPLTFSPASLTFASQTVGTTSLAKTVTVTNNLSTGVNITFASSGDFGISTAVTNGCGASLNGLAKCNFAVSFTPSSTGTILGVVTVSYTGSNFSPQELKLTGTGQ
jgi:trimeric autotransporter adhesin